MEHIEYQRGSYIFLQNSTASEILVTWQKAKHMREIFEQKLLNQLERKAMNDVVQFILSLTLNDIMIRPG